MCTHTLLLQLSYNQFSGSLPTGLKLPNSLKELVLTGNVFSGRCVLCVCVGGGTCAVLVRCAAGENVSMCLKTCPCAKWAASSAHPSCALCALPVCSIPADWQLPSSLRLLHLYQNQLTGRWG